MRKVLQVDQIIDKNLIEEKDNQNNSLLKSIEILAEMTRVDIERSDSYFDINLKLELKANK